MPIGRIQSVQLGGGRLLESSKHFVCSGRLRRPRQHVPKTHIGIGHPAPNANQATNENGPETADFRPVL
jgi:hypothetical protein